MDNPNNATPEELERMKNKEGVLNLHGVSPEELERIKLKLNDPGVSQHQQQDALLGEMQRIRKGVTAIVWFLYAPALVALIVFILNLGK